MNLHLPTEVGLALTKLLGPDWKLQSGLVVDIGSNACIGNRANTAIDAPDASADHAPLRYAPQPPASFSGASLFRITLPSTPTDLTLALKLTANLDPLRTKQIHRFQHSMHRELGAWISCPIDWTQPLNQAPSPINAPSNTLLRDPKSGSWELMHWLPGTVIPHVGLASQPQILSLATHLARFHRSAQHYTHHSPFTARHDHRLRDRLERLLAATQDKFAKQRAQLSSIASKSSHLDVHKCAQAIERCQQIASATLRPLQSLEQRIRNSPEKFCFWGHGDAWRGNWLFADDQITGLLDFAQADCRWQGFDFARAFGSLLLEADYSPANASSTYANGEAAWFSAWNAYTAEFPSPSFCLNDARCMHYVSTVLTFCIFLDNWVNQELPAHRQNRFDEILTALLHFQPINVTCQCRTD